MVDLSSIFLVDSKSSSSEAASYEDTNAQETLKKVKDVYEDQIGTQTNVFLAAVRTYVAGVLVPTAAVSISCAFNAHPTATVTLPADTRLFDVGRYDRVPVQIFVKETMVESPNYILLFEGFVTGRSYISMASQHEINLQCVAYTQMFADVKMQFMTSLEACFQGATPGEKAITPHIYLPGSYFPLCLFWKGLMYSEAGATTNTEAKYIDFPTEYLANLVAYVEEAGTKHSPAGRYDDSLVSQYYAMLALNLHMDRRFCWIPYFDYAVNEEEEKKLEAEAAKASTTTTGSGGTSASGGSGETKTASVRPLIRLLADTDGETKAGGTASGSGGTTPSGDTSDGKTSSEEKKEEDTSSDPEPPYDSCWAAEKIELGGDKSVMFPILYGLKQSVLQETLAGMLSTVSKEFSVEDLLKFLVEQMEYEFLVIPNPSFQAKGSGDDLGLEIDKDRKKYLDDELKEKWQTSTGRAGTSPVNELSDDEVFQTQVNVENKYAQNRNCSRMVNFCVKPMFDDTFPPRCNIIFRSQVLSIQANHQHYGVPTRIQVANLAAFANIASVETTSQTLLRFGSVDFYPSAYFGKGDTELGVGPGEATRALMSEKLDKIELRTGPWVVRHNAPSWVCYAFANQLNPSEDTIEQIRKMREQYMRRQLTRYQTMNRQLTAECVLLPYLTCGFPGVVYDSAESGFSFAGNVIAYEHNISPAGLTTTVTLNGVRLLAEAVECEQKGFYPNPINCVHLVTHNRKALKRIYASILGTRGRTISGAEPLTWANVQATYSGTVTNVIESPQTNIYQAYKLQRRNVVTFDDYCTFMELTKTPSGTDESGNPPTQIYNNWMIDRQEITVFERIPLQQNMVPGEVEAPVSAENQKKMESVQKEVDKLKDQQDDLVNGISKKVDDGTLTDADLESYQKKNSELQSQIDSKYSEMSALIDGSATGSASEKEKKQGYNLGGDGTDVRTLLQKVSEEERAHNIY